MPVRRPTLDELARIAQRHQLRIADAELAEYQQIIEGMLPSYDIVERLPEPRPAVAYARTPGYRPGPEENPHNAWYWRCAIRGAPEGLLSGKRVAIKDSVCVAGVPLMCGSRLLEGYVPDTDATVVTRILDAGGEIAGKAACEDLCLSGGSHTSRYGPVRNPRAPAYSAGGSSSGSAALVADGSVDMAIGGDQGGSIRIPSSCCGVVGLKPTYGLVPYTGAIPLDPTLDHLGPIARSVADAALLLEAIAGADGRDPRQPPSVPTQPYSQLLGEDLHGLRVGIVAEGFGWEGRSEPDVDELVRAAARRLGQARAEVIEVSIPFHRLGGHIWNAIGVEGFYSLLIMGNGLGTGWKGVYDSSLGAVIARGRAADAHALPSVAKLFLLLGEYLQHNYHGGFYAKAQNLARALADAYDSALAQVDLLAMPTTPAKPRPLPPPDCSLTEDVARSSDMDANLGQFDISGHPAISVPCGTSEELPVGMMLVGRRWEDATVLRAAHAFELLG